MSFCPLHYNYLVQLLSQGAHGVIDMLSALPETGLAYKRESTTLSLSPHVALSSWPPERELGGINMVRCTQGRKGIWLAVASGRIGRLVPGPIPLPASLVPCALCDDHARHAMDSMLASRKRRSTSTNGISESSGQRRADLEGIIRRPASNLRRS